ncbi:MAG: accessory gene regulator B family protein [Eubacterium sp.]
MNKAIINCYLNKITKLADYSNDDLEKIKYTLLTFLNESEKIIMLLLIFASLGMMEEFIVCVITLLCTRLYIGGAHMKTFWGCFAFSLIYFCGVLLFSRVFSADNAIITGVFIIEIVYMLILAPLPHPMRPVYTYKQKSRMKIKGIIGIGIMFVAYLWLPHKLANVIPCFLLIQEIETLIVAAKRKFIPLIQSTNN